MYCLLIVFQNVLLQVKRHFSLGYLSRSSFLFLLMAGLLSLCWFFVIFDTLFPNLTFLPEIRVLS